MKDEDLKSTKKQFKQLNDQVSIITMKYNMKIQKYEQEILGNISALHKNKIIIKIVVRNFLKNSFK